ncbi:ABC transporter ATP-binding protein [Bacillus swezeyi]|uniref:ABC transporter ATP-binding protein n=1 Tax=Bacillus swezeyi TaxID=1925020 RepID=UPI0039C67E8D
MIAEIKNLSKKFGDISILNDVNFNIEGGNIYCLLGRNGVGKTTLLKIIAGLISYDKGKIKISNQDDNREAFYFIPDSPIFLDYLSGYDNLRFIQSVVEKEEHYNILDLSRKFGLESFIHKLVVEYSQGMKEQLALLSGFLVEPNVLILDEPLTSLDPINIAIMKKSLTDYVSNHNSVLISTHLLPIAYQLSNKIIFLHEGHAQVIQNDFETLNRLEDEVLNRLK